jgi:hypothetical protein
MHWIPGNGNRIKIQNSGVRSYRSSGVAEWTSESRVGAFDHAYANGSGCRFSHSGRILLLPVRFNALRFSIRSNLQGIRIQNSGVRSCRSSGVAEWTSESQVGASIMRAPTVRGAVFRIPKEFCCFPVRSTLRRAHYPFEPATGFFS